MQKLKLYFVRTAACFSIVFSLAAVAATASLAVTPRHAAAAATDRRTPPDYDYYAWQHLPYQDYAYFATPAARTAPHPIPAPWPSSAADLYPPGDVVGPYEPLPFPNYNPQADPDKGTIEVILPVYAAKVYLNGERMRGTGIVRIYTTAVLPFNRSYLHPPFDNREYQYQVTAKYADGGRVVTKYRKIDVGAGEYAVADFTHPALNNPIHLPPGLVDENEVVR